MLLADGWAEGEGLGMDGRMGGRRNGRMGGG